MQETPDAVPVGEFPAGPWTIIVGMHRSGTSAVAGVIGSFGLSMPRQEDRIRSHQSNPEHWESHSIMLHNDAVLDRLGGSWDAPPELEPGWEGGPQLVDVPDPGPVVSSTYPSNGPLVWKDPRVCLLLPYWRRLMPEPVAAIFVWRSPVAVARSLQKRDGFSVVHGLALWERYNRAALDGLRGLDVFVLSYEALMTDHRSGIRSVADWLGSLEQLAAHADDWDVDQAISLISDDLQHEAIDDPAEGYLLPEHRSMTKLLSELHGGYRAFDPGPLPDESPWTKDILGDRREARLALKRESDCWERVAERVHKVNLLEAELGPIREVLAGVRESLDKTRGELEYTSSVLATMRNSASWRVTRPLRYVSERAAALTSGENPHRGAGPR